MVVTSTILDASGNPIKRAELKEPQTSKLAQLHREFASHPSRGLTPIKLARILEAAEQGDIRAQHELFMDMEEKDAHIYAEMGKRKRALLTVDWDIVPPRNASATERKLAGYAKELLQDTPNFEDVILDALDGIGHGFSCQEIEWELLGNEWLPKQITHRPQGWFQTDRDTRTEIRLRDNTLDGQALQPFSWITHVHKAKSGYIARAGLHRVLSWPFLFKTYSVGDLAEFLEIYGLPLRLGKYQSGASDDEKSTLLRAVMSIGHDAAGIIPEGMSIDFQEAAKGASDPFMAMIDWAEKSQSKAILGGTLTSQADGKSSTNALGNVHNEVRHDLMVSDAIQLAGTLTRDLVYPLLALNKGGVDDRRRLPKFKFMFDDTEDLGTLADALPKLVGIGMRIPSEWAHERAGIPQAEEGVEVLGVPKPAPTNPSTGNGAALNVALAALSSNGSKPIEDWSVVMDNVGKLVGRSASMPSLQQALLSSYADLPLDDLRRVMAQGFQLAVLSGMADAQEQTWLDPSALTDLLAKQHSETLAALSAKQPIHLTAEFNLPNGLVQAAAAAQPVPNVQVDVHIPPQPAPNVQVDVHVPTPSVQVDVAAAPAPVVQVAAPNVTISQPDRTIETTLTKDSNGEIVKIVKVETDLNSNLNKGE